MKSSPRLFRVLLEVANLDQASAFYNTLLGVEGRRVGGGRCYYDCGEVIVGLLDGSASGRKPAASPQDLYFAVSEVEEFHSRAKSLGCLSKEQVHGASAADVITRPWGERCFYAVDPFGNGLCFSDEKTLFTGK